ncbi:MAG TPA: DUF3307 domain-containing protein [Chloroflexaceae bacterium]|nr:DUF3307 domain-containing protein [Chloroflexaceae bacterium]
MFYLFLLAHLAADFALQPLWLVRRKGRWDGLLLHVGVVLAAMLALGAVEPAARGLWPAMLGIAAAHLAADRWKVRHADRLFRPPFVPFLLDQAAHVATIAAALSLALPAELVWSPAATPLAWPAIYLSAYIVAALATPIGLIVLLDPAFQHAERAAMARARSLVAAVAVLTLALLAGPAALPLTLAGLALAAQRPASPHPLDAPGGLLAVAIIAASAGAALAWAG